jgi:serine/threonine protein phosphatase PrpC
MKKRLVGALVLLSGLSLGEVVAFGTEAASAVGDTKVEAATEIQVPQLVVGRADAIGWRPTMEDEMDEQSHNGLHFFAVFDGHAGKRAAEFAKEKLFANMLREFPEAHERAQLTPLQVAAAIKSSFHSTDREFFAHEERDNSGTCVLSALFGVSSRALEIAWAGDSRALLIRKGRLAFATVDHKPSDAAEQKRIEGAGSFVGWGGRVNGTLAVSRAFGDFGFKSFRAGETASSAEIDAMAVTPAPEVAHLALDGSEDYLLLACDGVFERLTNEQVIAFINKELSNRKLRPDEVSAATAKEIAAALVRHAIAMGSGDNVSVQLVFFHRADAVDKKI